MDRISQKIAPIWERVHERHVHARDDQIIYELYQRLKADNFQVKCVLGGRQLCKAAMKSIETIAFCMDIKQVKAMQEQGGEHFYSFSEGDGQITKESTKLIDEGQVRKWFKRNKKILEIAEFKKKGCLYAQPEWQKIAAEERRKDRTLARFGKQKPWEKVSNRQVLRAFDEAGKLAKDGKSGTALIPASGSVVKAPKVNAWSRPMPTNVAPRPAPSRNGALQHVPPTQPRGLPATHSVQPRGVPSPLQQASRGPWAATTNNAPASIAANPMARNTSYPVANNPSRRSSSSRSSNPNFPGRGAPVQSIRPKSRSNSRSLHGASVQNARRSRSNSREHTRPQADSKPMTSAAPVRITRAWTNSPSMVISRPPVEHYEPTSRSSSGSSDKPYARSVVVKFDTNQLIADFLTSRFQAAGVNQPRSVKVENGHAYITFSSRIDANLASRSRICYENGGAMEIQSVEQFRQTNI